MPELELPVLRPPTEARVFGMGGGGGPSEVRGSARLLASSLTSADVLAHYVTQLVAAGWTAATPAVTDRVAVQPLDARDKDGKPWKGSIVVADRGADREITILMNKVVPQ